MQLFNHTLLYEFIIYWEINILTIIYKSSKIGGKQILFK